MKLDEDEKKMASEEITKVCISLDSSDQTDLRLQSYFETLSALSALLLAAAQAAFSAPLQEQALTQVQLCDLFAGLLLPGLKSIERILGTL